MAELGLKKEDIDAIKFAFDVYDLKGDGRVDTFYTGDLFSTYNLNSTLKTIKEIGRITEKGQEEDNFDDFMKNLKLYDTKANNQPSQDDNSNSKEEGKTNEVLKAIKILIGEIKRNPVDTPQNIKTQVPKMPIPPLQNHLH